MKRADSATYIRALTLITCYLVDNVFTKAKFLVKGASPFITNFIIYLFWFKSRAKGISFMVKSNIEPFASETISYFTVYAISDVRKIKIRILFVFLLLAFMRQIRKSMRVLNKNFRVFIYSKNGVKLGEV